MDKLQPIILATHVNSQSINSDLWLQEHLGPGWSNISNFISQSNILCSRMMMFSRSFKHSFIHKNYRFKATNPHSN